MSLIDGPVGSDPQAATNSTNITNTPDIDEFEPRQRAGRDCPVGIDDEREVQVVRRLRYEMHLVFLEHLEHGAELARTLAPFFDPQRILVPAPESRL